MDKYVSVIVPVYNVEKYLNRCIESIINQTYRNIEILLIDDGSVDNSLAICKSYQLKDNRIQVFHKENEGLGLTRNYGIERAKGEFLCFVDSDDYIEIDAISILVSNNDIRDCDLVIGNFYYLDKKVSLPICAGVFSGKEVISEILYKIVGSLPGKNDQLIPSSGGKLYKKKILDQNSLKFPSERELIWEDLAFNFEYILNCKIVTLEDRPIYRYCYNENSLTHRYDADKLKKIIIMYNYMQKKIQPFQNNSELVQRLNNNFMGHIRTCLKLEAFYDKQNGIPYTIQRIKQICSNKEVKRIVESVPDDSCSTQQRLLSFGIKRQWIMIVYCLCKLQNIKKKIV